MMVRTLALGLPAGARLGTHDHPWAQLVYAPVGMTTVTTTAGAWIVPPQRAVWIEPATPHAIETTNRASVRMLYLRPDVARRRSESCGVLHVSPLLRELVVEIVRRGHLDDRLASHLRLAAVLADLLSEATAVPWDLPLPRDPRARVVADRVRADPGSRLPLSTLAVASGASPRTIERLFAQQTTMAFGRWRQQVRLLHAIALLGCGASVTEVALQCGYDSTSAFIAMFKRSTGTTPSRYFDTVADP